jgi:hypothetical protein
MKERRALILAINKASVSRGEAQWTHGYRCGRNSVPFKEKRADAEDERLYRKEMDQWDRVAKDEQELITTLAVYVKALRTQAVAKGRAPQGRGTPSRAARRGKTKS